MTQRIKVLTYRVNGKSFEIKECIHPLARITSLHAIAEDIKSLERLKISYQITYTNVEPKK